MELVEKQTKRKKKVKVRNDFSLLPFFDNWENTLEESMGTFPDLIAVEFLTIPQTTRTRRETFLMLHLH